MTKISEVYVMSAVRTAIGGYGGSLKSLKAAELGALCVKEALHRADVDGDTVESCVMGSVLRYSSRDCYVARVASVDGGLPVSSHAVTVNRLCGSGLEAIVTAAQQVQLGEVQTAVAGGTESMSNASYTLPSNRWGQRMGNGEIMDDMTMALQDPWEGSHMGITAENVADEFDIDREAQDKFAANSHKKAANAIEEGRFKAQILPVEIKSRRGVTVFDTDEHVRADTTAEGLSKLKPFFKKDGSVTAATSSGLNDGASMVVLMSGDRVEADGRKPMAKLVGYARAGVSPHIMGTGPIPAVKKVLETTGLSLADLDVIESNEAFAAQALCVNKGAGLPADKVNPNGGAVALGHPIGATGAILTTKCLYELKRVGGKYGLVTMCIGGGQGIAAIYENID